LVGEYPPRRRVPVADETTAGGQCVGNTIVGHFGRHMDVDVQAVALRPRRFHLLEPDRRPETSRVVNVVDLLSVCGRAVDVAEHRRPERAYRIDVERIDGEFEHARGLRLAHGTGACGERRDRRGQVCVEVGESSGSVCRE
jgi:hypothetical protein